MHYTRRAAVGLVAMWISATAYGQATQSEELSTGRGTVSAGKTAKSLAEDAITAKGWQPGVNKKGDSRFFVAIGIGDIQAPIDDPAYLTSRVTAYDKALMSAWAAIRQFVSQDVSANARSAYEEAEGEVTSGAEEPSATETKVRALVGGVLDKSLEELGIDPKSATPEQKEKAIATEQFSKQVATVAAGPIIGIQSYATYEGRGGGKGYQIAVVAIWSERLQGIAEACITMSKMPAGVPGKPLPDWIPQDSEILMTTFGVQMVSDETGHPVLISYGQARAISESSRSVDAAYSKAKMAALSYLRFFAGAQVKAMDDFNKAESTQEFADATKTYESSESFTQSVEAYAPAQKFSGVTQIKTWSCPHPITKKTLAGAVITWRPEDALLAGAIGRKMAAPPRTAPTGQPGSSAGPARKPLEASDQGRTGQGATGSDDF